MYLALTGARLTHPADLLHTRLATHYVPRAQLSRLRAALASSALPENPGRRPGGAGAPAPAAAAPPAAGGRSAGGAAPAQDGKEAALAAVQAVVAEFQVQNTHCILRTGRGSVHE